MQIYWLMFALPLLGGLAPIRPNRLTRRILFVVTFLVLTVIIGGRDVVGCDWDSYLNHYYAAAENTFGDALAQDYPAYSVLNWIATRLGLTVHAVNTVCGAIFSFGLLSFAARQPRPWLTILTAMPYLIIVVAMGFTRQATAIGLLMLAFNAFVDRSLVRYLVFVGLAGLFHSSAVALAPMAVFIRRDAPMSPLIIGGLASGFLILTVLFNVLDRYLYAYVESAYEGEGALYRLPLNAAAGLAVLALRKPWMARFNDIRLYALLGLASWVVLPFAFFLTVVGDRMSLYLLPFQVAVAARLPDLVSRRYRGLVLMGVVAAYALMLFVWLNYANHSYCWLPYSSVYF